MFIFQTPPQMREKGLKMSLGVFARRSSVLDQTGADGQEAPGGACRQHGQVPLRGVGQPHAHHPLAQERQRLQGRAAHGRHQGQPGNTRFGLRRSHHPPDTYASDWALLYAIFQAITGRQKTVTCFIVSLSFYVVMRLKFFFTFIGHLVPKNTTIINNTVTFFFFLSEKI